MKPPVSPGSDLAQSAPEEVTRQVSLVPPRPNRGPEPLESSEIPSPLVLGTIAAAILMGLVLLWRRRAREIGIAPGSREVLPQPLGDSPEGRLLALASRVRGLLANRFDPTWLAKTTEEIEGEGTLLEKVGPEEALTCVAILRAADLLKFAGSPRNGSQGLSTQKESLEGWERWAESFFAAGASSKSRGK